MNNAWKFTRKMVKIKCYEAPSRPAIVNLIKKFKSTGQVSGVKTLTRARKAKSVEDIAAVTESVAENPGLSIKRRSQKLGISQINLHCISHKDLGMHAYKVRLTQELKPGDHGQRRTFADWVLEMKASDADFLKNAKVHFHLQGFVNKKNCCIWGTENLRLIVEQPLHPQRVTV